MPSAAPPRGSARSEGARSLDLPIDAVDEVADFLKSVPLAVDIERFTRFVVGFPRRYLAATPRGSIVKHYALMESRGEKSFVSALAREGDLWKLELVCGDRDFLFSRIAGSLSARGMSIVDAEAFANAQAFVLDTFRFHDAERVLETTPSRREFQGFLEGVAVGRTALEPLLRPRLAHWRPPAGARFEVALDNDSHPTATRLRLGSPDFPGLLYLVTRALSEAGCSIETAYVRTAGGRAEDVFFVTSSGPPNGLRGSEGARLDDAARQALTLRLSRLPGDGLDPALL
jgi:[protein-PII] uridylyltransferase